MDTVQVSEVFCRSAEIHGKSTLRSARICWNQSRKISQPPNDNSLLLYLRGLCVVSSSQLYFATVEILHNAIWKTMRKKNRIPGNSLQLKNKSVPKLSETSTSEGICQEIQEADFPSNEYFNLPSLKVIFILANKKGALQQNVVKMFMWTTYRRGSRNVSKSEK